MRSVIPHIILQKIKGHRFDVGLEKNMMNIRKFFNVSVVAVAGVFCGYWLSSQQTDVPARSIVKDAVSVTSEAELAEVTNAVVHESEEEDQEQPDLIPAKANTTRDKTVTEGKTETVSTVSNKAVEAVVTKEPEQPVSEIASIETTAPVEVVDVPPVETQITDTIQQSAPVVQPVEPATPVIIGEDYTQQVIDDYNAVADAALADVLNSLDL